jgi:FKBP-type peptidyl-prolyl cis-trans isomerase SlyD
MKTQVISFHCILKNRLGQVLSATHQNEVINSFENVGSLGDLASGLQDVRAGEKRLIAINAERAYGLYDPELVGELLRCDLASGTSLSVGDTLSLYSPEKKYSREFRVTQAGEDWVVVDGNHPFAGQDLLFDVEILAAREMRPDDEEFVAKQPVPHRQLN